MDGNCCLLSSKNKNSPLLSCLFIYLHLKATSKSNTFGKPSLQGLVTKKFFFEIINVYWYKQWSAHEQIWRRRFSIAQIGPSEGWSVSSRCLSNHHLPKQQEKSAVWRVPIIQGNQQKELMSSTNICHFLFVYLQRISCQIFSVGALTPSSSSSSSSFSEGVRLIYWWW